MLRLSPTDTLPVTCPSCLASSAAVLGIGQVRFGGAVTVVDTQCPACGKAFYQTLTNGQFNRFPVSVSADGQHVHVPERGRWLVEQVKACNAEAPASVGTKALTINILPTIEAIHCPVKTSALLLFCLDPCYGHALMMLFNAQRHHEPSQRTAPNQPIIAVVPRALAWLVPDYVAETWVIDAPLSALRGNVPGLDAFVKQQLTRFEQVWFSTAHIHFDHRTTRFSDFTRTPKFALDQFDAGPIRYVTLVLREDRLWLRHGWERLLHKAVARLGLGQRTRPLWARWQAVRYRKLAHHIHQQMPGLRGGEFETPIVTITAVGLTAGGQHPIDLGYGVDDQRQTAPLTPEQERTWCAQYARSHVVVGVHGSGMLLPTSLAAGFVSLLPPDKLAHYAEDVLLAHENPIHQTLLGRFLPTSASPRQVADMIVTMLTEFSVWLAEARERE